MTFKERLNMCLNEMLAFRSATGYATDTIRHYILNFIVFCTEQFPDAERITQEMIDEWISIRYSDKTKQSVISALRQYTHYLHFMGYDDYIPDDEYQYENSFFEPYLFTDDELSQLFHAIDNYTGKTSGKRHLPEIVLPVYARLLYCCGLRPSEPMKIKTEDLDLNTGDLYIRESKQNKDRHIIMSSDMLNLCRRYDDIMPKREFFFQKWDGSQLKSMWFWARWITILKTSGINWRGQPRPYDLRHAFATRNLIRWLNEKKNIMELIPYLSAYMGHATLSSTYYYIHLLPEKLRESCVIDWEKLNEIYGDGEFKNED